MLMPKTLPDKWRKWLIDQPETGMGYHIVDVVLSDRSIDYDVIVFNCSQICGHFDPNDIVSMSLSVPLTKKGV